MIENVELPGMPPRDQDVLNTQFEQMMEALFAANSKILDAINAALDGGEYQKAMSCIKIARSHLASAATGLAKLSDGE